jgi:hypothetical protein
MSLFSSFVGVLVKPALTVLPDLSRPKRDVAGHPGIEADERDGDG